MQLGFRERLAQMGGQDQQVLQVLLAAQVLLAQMGLLVPLEGLGPLV